MMAAVYVDGEGGRQREERQRENRIRVQWSTTFDLFSCLLFNSVVDPDMHRF